ncbi:MAG TPA: carboxypeptidase regulatory-like domain-containing protein [Pyrinomonadaceae bacterium]|jgi:hypothetical protein|nr:carboxypeptidase regulatory-like domain-containing protein [Pyrinomonadaceae bacterium]
MPKERARFLVALFTVLCLLAFSPACGRDEDEEDADDAGAGAAEVSLTPYKTTGNEGSVTGTVTFTGAAPAPKAISMDQDPVCSSTNPNAVAEDMVVNGDKLQNVFIYIKDGKTSGADAKSITSLSFAPPAEPKVLDQHGCHYVPHVVGVQTNQVLRVTNSDATPHNINAQAAKNERFNQGQGPGAPALEKKFQRAEILIPVKCQQHPWMRSWVGVVSHPFFAVSDQAGKFEIKGLPPGTYTLVAWHEKFKQEQTQSITVGAKEGKEANFTFAAEAMAAELNTGSLQLMPAIEFPMLGHH